MGKYDAVGIQIGVNFEEYKSVKSKLDALLSKFAQCSKSIDIDINIKDVNKQLREIEKTIKTLDGVSKTVATDMANAFSKGVKTIGKEAEKVKKQADKKSSINTNAFGSDDALLAYMLKVEHQMKNIGDLKIDDTLRDKLKKLGAELSNLTSDTSKTDLQAFKNSLSDLSKEAKEVDKVSKSFDKLKNNINSLPKADGLPNGLFDSLNITDLIQKANTLKIRGEEGQLQTGEIQKMATEYDRVVKKIREAQSETKKHEQLAEGVTDEINLLKIKYENAMKSMQVSNIGKYLDPEAVRKFEQALEKLDGNDLKEVTREARILDQELISLRNNAQEVANKSSFFGTIGNAFKTMSGYYLSGQMLSQLSNGLRFGVQSVVELDTALVDLKKVSTETDSTLKGFVGTANAMAIDLGHSTTAVLSSVTDFIKIGSSFKEAQELAKATIIYSNVGDMEIGSATEAMVSTMKAFKYEASEAMEIVDKLNEVANKYAVTAEGLGEALKRSASSLSVAGNDLDQSLAMIAGANAVVQNAPKVGNALKTISMRLRGLSEDTGELIPNLRETFMLLTDGKVDIMIDDDNFKSTYDIMVDLGSVWDSLTDTARAFIAEISSGKTQANVFVSLMENIEDVEKAYVDSMNSQGSAMKEQEAYMTSLQAKINALKESVVAFWNSLIDSGAIAFVLDGLTDLVNLATKLVDTFGSLPAILMTLGGGLGVFKPKMMGNLTGDVGKFFGDAVEGISLINEEAIRLGANGKKSIGSVITATTKMVSTSKTATTAMSILGTTIKSIGLGFGIGIVIQGIISLIKYVSEADERLQQAIDNAQSNIAALNGEISTLDDLSNKYKTLATEIENVGGYYEASNEQREAYVEVSQQLLDIIPQLEVSYTEEGQAILVANQNIQEHIDKKKELLELEKQNLAYNASAQLGGQIHERDNVQKAIEKKQKEIAKHERIIKDLEKSQSMYPDDGLNQAKINLEKQVIAELSHELRGLQIELAESDSKIDNTVNSVLDGSEAYNSLSDSQKIAVKSLLEFNEGLGENTTFMNETIISLSEILGELDKFALNKMDFDEQAFDVIKGKLEALLATTGMAEKDIQSLSSKILNPFKQAWIESSKYIDKNVDTMIAFNDELKTLGGNVLDHAEKIQGLKTALKELDKDNALSSQTLRGLIDEYPELITAIGDEERQRRILMDAIVEQEKLQEDVIQNIVELERQAIIQKMEMDNDFYDHKVKTNTELVNIASEAFGIELSRYQDLAQAKEAIDRKFMERHSKIMGLMAQETGTIKNGYGQRMDMLDTQINQMENESNPVLKAGNQLLLMQLKNQRSQLQQEMNAYKKDLGEKEKFQSEWESLLDDEIDFSNIGTIGSGLPSLNKPSSSSGDKKPKEEKKYEYSGSELSKYGNELQKIIEKIDDYDKAITEAYEKKERLHEKKMFEEEIALIEEITKKEEKRGEAYLNRVADIEANNKAVLEEFKKQEGFTLSKWSEAELDKIYNDIYGADITFDSEEEKKSWEAKGKAFKDYVEVYYDGVEQIESLRGKLVDTNEALVQLSVDKYNVQVEIDDKKLRDSANAITNLGRELEILQTIGGDNLNQQVNLMAQIAGAETYQRQEMERQIVLLQQKLALLSETDAEYQLIIDRVKQLQDAQYDSYLNELRYRNEIKKALLEEMELELEKSLYGSDGQQAWEDANNAKINALKDELDLLKQQTSEKKEQEEREKRLLEIQKLREKLENLKRQKTVQQLKQNADGSWEWEYVADQEAIADLEQQIKDKEQDEENRREEEEQKKKEEELQKEIDRLNDEAKLRREALQRMLNDLRKHFDKESDIFEMSGNDIQDIVENTLNSLDKLYNGKFSGIIENMRDKMGEMSQIFEDAKDEAEGWYEDSVKLPSSNGSGSSGNKPPETSKPDKTDEEKKAWHDNKDRVAKQMEANSKAWHNASASEKKQLEQDNEKLAKQIGAWKNSSTGVWYIEVFNQKMPLFDSIGYRKFKTGGETQETGLQWLDGQKGRPERVLSAEQTQSFNRMVQIMPDFLRKMDLFSALAPSLAQMVQGAMGGSMTVAPNPLGATPSGNSGQTVIVENIELPNVQDADSFRKEMAQFLQGSFSGLSQSAKVQKSK